LHGHVRLDEHCYQDKKNRTYRQLLGKGFEPKLLQDAKTGQVIEIAPDSAVRAALPKAKASGCGDDYREQQRAQERKQRAECAYRAELFLQVRNEAQKQFPALTRTDLELIAEHQFRRLDHDSTKRLFKTLNWEVKKSGMHGGVTCDLPTPIEKLTDAELAQLLRDLTLAGELYVGGYALDSKPERLLAAAKWLGVDAKAVRKKLAQEAAAKAKAKASKKKGRKS
jgi:hypothetical protein